MKYYCLDNFTRTIESIRASLMCHSPLCVFAVCFYQVVDVSKRISDVPEWFKGARLNYAENLLKHADHDKVALYAASMYILKGILC